jgi:hypothetical protein
MPCHEGVLGEFEFILIISFVKLYIFYKFFSNRLLNFLLDVHHTPKVCITKPKFCVEASFKRKMDRANNIQEIKEVHKGFVADLMSSYLHENEKYCSTMVVLSVIYLFFNLPKF